MKKGAKTMLRVLLWIVAVIVILILICFVYHRYRLNAEKKLREPLGQLVDINGNNMSIYVEGSGSRTLVFLSGGGTCSPILDFKSLYSLLRDDYRIVVVEKFGYGYSDIVDEDRNIQTILSETRLALNKAGIDGPYVLCPHSMSGIEALYWAQEYPDEIESIIGLDMAVPEYYENMKINLPLMKLGQYAADLGITRLIPTLAESDAIKHGTLTNDEKNRYRAIFYNRTATVTMINEAKSVKDNAIIVAQNGVPQVPMLLFISDGTGGTGFDKETWRRIQEKYISEVESGKYIELDCPHYVHDYEYGRISEEIKSFLSD
jgi:pimeloyl-ACP methyl ester carboxylesterase